MSFQCLQCIRGGVSRVGGDGMCFSLERISAVFGVEWGIYLYRTSHCRASYPRLTWAPAGDRAPL